MHTGYSAFVIASLMLCIASYSANSQETASAAPAYPPAPAPADTSDWARHIQRSMTLMATSTAEHRNRVHVLFYGQSITKQDWWKAVARDLRELFPHADLEIENRAIGGFSSQYLVHTAEHDLYPTYPDLVIFHVYGHHLRYRDIIARARARTTAEVAIYTDHYGAKSDKDGEPDLGNWGRFMANWMRKVAEAYGCDIIDITTPWKEYLLSNDLKAQALLKDGIHLNEHGMFLMAELVERQLVYRPELPDDEWKDLVKTYEIGRDVQWKDGRLRLEFDGNRVVALAAPHDGRAPAAGVLVDGKARSEYPGCYAYTLPSSYPEVGWPVIMHVGFRERPVVEEWTATITEISEDHATFGFKVAGSVTGPDGEGTNSEPFVSDSGRATIAPDAWCLKRSFDFTEKPIAPGFEVKWQTVPLFADSYTAPKVEDPTREYQTVLVQGIPNGRHVLELVAEGEGVPPIAALRVHKPPVAEEPDPELREVR